MNKSTIISYMCFTITVILFAIRIEGPQETFIASSMFTFFAIMLLPIIGVLFGLKANKFKTMAILLNVLCIGTISFIQIMAALAFS